MIKKPILVIEKRNDGSTKKEIRGIYRSINFPMPKVGDPVRIVNNTEGTEFSGVISAVNLQARTYDVQYLKDAPDKNIQDALAQLLEKPVLKGSL
ncbi:MAG: hypothetical protein GYA45_11710 [Pelolinea sp.]|nr:hypothetical protein [Pelolinea sp.]